MKSARNDIIFQILERTVDFYFLANTKVQLMLHPKCASRVRTEVYIQLDGGGREEVG